jgi:DNA polymerase I-like protein with 3'-5' exonuclease and polymerase domains
MTGLLGPKVMRARRVKGPPKPGMEYVDRFGVPFTPPDGCKKLADCGEIYEKPTFNPGSYVQILAYCDAMGYDVPKNRKTGRETVDELSITKIMAKHPEDKVLSHLLNYRESSKVISTYCEVLRDEDDKVRFTLVPGTVVSARFASKKTWWDTGFNAQNIPKSFRNVIVPHGRDFIMFNMDLKQADPHLVAWLSGCDTMLHELKRKGGDLHIKTACAIAGRDITQDPGFDKDKSIERKLGKLVNNGLNYGMQPATFAQNAAKQGLALTIEEATHAYEAYFKLYPEVREWQESIKRSCDMNKRVTTPFGRVLTVYGKPTYKTYNEAMSWIPQSTVADVVNMTWNRFIEKVDRDRVFIRLQAHDAIAGEVHKDYMNEALTLLKQSAAEVVFQIGRYECNIAVDISTGPNLRDQKTWSPT